MKYLIALLSMAPATLVHAGENLTRQDRVSLFESVYHICNSPNPIGHIIRYSGSLETDAILKIEGVSAAPKINKRQWKFFEQKYYEFKADPKNCKNQLVKAMHTFFGIISCRNPIYGIERFQKEVDLEQKSEWLDDRSDLETWCNRYIKNLYREHGDADFQLISKYQQVKIMLGNPSSKSYMFTCHVHAQMDPLYSEKPGGC